MKIFKLSAYLVILSFFGQIGCMNITKNYIHWAHSKIMGFKDISERSFPKTLAYFEKLRIKYPKALHNIKIVMSPMPYQGPVSSSYFIIFPLSWIEDLEKEIEQTQLLTEWVILHEAGHIYYEHLAKSTLAQNATYALVAGSYFVISQKNPKYSLTSNQKLGLYIATSLVLSLGHIVYSRYVMEPQADDFANELCDNPKAFIEAAKWFDRVAFDGITHPSCASRIKKIEQAAQNKFGISLFTA